MTEKVDDIDVYVKNSKVGPCTLHFKRYHDNAMNTYVTCDKDPSRTLRVWKISNKELGYDNLWAAEIQEKPSTNIPRGRITSYGGSVLFHFSNAQEAWKFIVARAW